MNVLHICPDYFGTKVYRRLCSALATSKISQRIYVPANHPPTNTEPGVLVAGKSFNVLERFLYFGKQNWLYRDIVGKHLAEGVDVIHAHKLFTGGYLALRLKRTFGVPYVVAIRNTDINDFFRRMPHLQKVGRTIMAEARKVLFISHAYRKQVLERWCGTGLRREIEKKSLVIPNGADRCFLQDRFSGAHPRDGQLRILHVGSIDPNKNLALTVKACQILQSQGVEVRYVVIGPVKDCRYGGKNLEYPFVEYLGPLPPEEVKKHMRHAHVFVMPSKTETFGLVYVEALSQGLPVVYTRGQGFDGWVADGSAGWAVSPCDPGELARKILDIWGNYQTFAANAAAVDLSPFDWENIAIRYREIYAEAISTAGQTNKKESHV